MLAGGSDTSFTQAWTRAAAAQALTPTDSKRNTSVAMWLRILSKPLWAFSSQYSGLGAAMMITSCRIEEVQQPLADDGRRQLLHTAPQSRRTLLLAFRGWTTRQEEQTIGLAPCDSRPRWRCHLSLFTLHFSSWWSAARPTQRAAAAAAPPPAPGGRSGSAASSCRSCRRSP